MLQDRELVCQDCNQTWTFTAEEQQWMIDRGFLNEPKRCKACRQARRDKSRGEYQIICSQCGKADAVNFLPRDDSDILCHECYRNKK
jgi:CxxC-x17-CxxC domain-containing protein